MHINKISDFSSSEEFIAQSLAVGGLNKCKRLVDEQHSIKLLENYYLKINFNVVELTFMIQSTLEYIR